MIFSGLLVVLTSRSNFTLQIGLNALPGRIQRAMALHPRHGRAQPDPGHSSVSVPATAYHNGHSTKRDEVGILPVTMIPSPSKGRVRVEIK